jgi:large subunit ribosomal protein L4
MAFARRNRDYRYTMPKKAIRTALRMAILSKFQDGQALVVQGLSTTAVDAKPKTKAVAQTLRSIARPDLAEGPDAAAGETKAAALKRTVASGSVLIGLPSFDPVLYQSARNIEGVEVAPVGEFNTYDVLKQRYLILTPESLTALRDMVKEKPARRPQPAAPVAG